MSEGVQTTENIVVEAANRQKRTHLFVVGGLILLGVCTMLILLKGLLLNPTQVPSALIGKKANPFSATYVQGNLKLSDPGKIQSIDTAGRPLILNFWASWCVSCRDEARFLEAFWQSFKDKELLVVGIAIQDSHEEAKKFASLFGKTYPLALDEDGKATFDYGVHGVPETFFIDRQGVIQHKETGPVTPEILDKYANLIL